MHHQVSNNYYNTQYFTCATDDFNNGYKIYYVLPKDGFNVKDCFNNDLVRILGNRIFLIKRLINYSVPKFEFKNELDLVKASKNLGVNDVFDSSKSNLSKIGENLFVSDIKQIAGIKLTEFGVEAAASTIINGITSTGVDILPIEFVLNKPFLYYITDSTNNVIFMGVCNNPIFN